MTNQNPSMTRSHRILGGLWGSVVGDALGVPVEFKNRDEVQANPVTDMRGYGTHRQPPGTWSDDSSLLLCTVDSLIQHEFNTDDMGRRFVEWMYRGLWTPHGEPFDVGMATSDALMSIANGTPVGMAGRRDEYSNGNGSLMRILPAVLRFASEPTDQFVPRVEQVSAITHAHARSKMACVLHGMIARQLQEGSPLALAVDAARVEFTGWYEQADEFSRFRKLLEDEFVTVKQGSVVSTGYVLHTLHASLWCMFNSASFEECVLKAVNLGGDTDTTGCVAGGLAGVYYGFDSIPRKWIEALARKEDVESVFSGFTNLVMSGL